ncbi:MAG TPA: MFS transporter [Caulobacteraceae bacterium]|jgi:PAT family beta-lactamase induction signal transducer AmpG
MSIEDGPRQADRRGVLGALVLFLDRRILVMLALGFASGLPNLLIFDTLSAWLRESGLSLEVISFFSLATLAYSFKFLWAPLVDRTAIPVLTAWLGHRRSWMLVAQLAVTTGLLLVARGDPRTGLGTVALFAVFTGFASATQDIVVDAWRIEASDSARQGAMAAAYQWGYRIAIIIAGAVPLVLADHLGWNLSYGLMAGLMGIGVLAVLGAPRELTRVIRALPHADMQASPLLEGLEWIARLSLLLLGGLLLGSGLGANAELLAKGLSVAGLAGAGAALSAAWVAKPDGVWLQLAGVVVGAAVIVIAAWPIPRLRTRPGLYLSSAFGEPLGDFFGRFGNTAVLILALICVYRLSDFVLNIMTPFYLDLGFSKTQVAEARKVFGVAMSMVGVFAGGFSVARLGVMRSMVIGAFALPITNTIFAWLATRGPDFNSLLAAIGIDNIVSGFAGTCLIAYMSSLTSAGFTATQYALFSSLYSLPGKLIASQSGRIVESAARAAQDGGPFASLKGLFDHAPAGAFAGAMAKSHVAPSALGAGYVVFFSYSGLVGVLSMVLAVWVARRTRTDPQRPIRASPAPAGTTG